MERKYIVITGSRNSDSSIKKKDIRVMTKRGLEKRYQKGDVLYIFLLNSYRRRKSSEQWGWKIGDDETLPHGTL